MNKNTSSNGLVPADSGIKVPMVAGYSSHHNVREGEPMIKITAMAIDLDKTVFQIVGENAQGEVVLRMQPKSHQAMHNSSSRSWSQR